jgi:hypothetical protein
MIATKAKGAFFRGGNVTSSGRRCTGLKPCLKHDAGSLRSEIGKCAKRPGEMPRRSRSGRNHLKRLSYLIPYSVNR